MRFRADVTRLLLGLHGLALLRGWPAGDERVAARHIDAMRALLAASDSQRVVEIDDAGLAAAYEVWVATYDDEANGLIDAEQRIVGAMLDELPSGRAIDVACGTGRLSRELIGRGHAVVGVDRSMPMMAVARRRLTDARFVLGDLQALPFRDASACLVVCGLALTHVADLGPAVSELGRVVRPGGHVLLSDLHPLAAATGAQAQPARPDGIRLLARNHVHWTSDYVRAFGAAGLTVVRCEEPRVDETFLATIADDIREPLAEAFLGLPVAIVWLLRRD